MVLSILALEIFKPVDGYIGHVSQVVLNLSKFSLNLHQQFVYDALCTKGENKAVSVDKGI